MLTEKLLKENTDLSTLTAEQVAAITTLSANDEATVISAKTGEIHGRLETDVKTVSGLDKNEGEKSYDFLKRVLGDFKESAKGSTTLKADLAAEKSKIAGLEQKILDGKGNEAVAQKLKDAESKFDALKLQFDTEKTGWDTEKTGFKDTITGIKVAAEISKATAGLKFKAAYPDSVQKTLLTSAKATVLSTYKPDWYEEKDGSKTMVFRDKNGDIAKNSANGLEPFTAKELISAQLKDVLEVAKVQKGGGTGNPKGPNPITIADLSDAKSQIDADRIIVKHLLGQGLLKGTQDFADGQSKLRKENNISKLPMR